MPWQVGATAYRAQVEKALRGDQSLQCNAQLNTELHNEWPLLTAGTLESTDDLVTSPLARLNRLVLGLLGYAAGQ